ncbi:hypothetical protein ACBP93_04445 [Paenalcaligenes hominis]|uniref:hypothetical protein n=1 Tax=Paenalcaligenes hominis TaxID=643674 RepID=UPI00352369DE
MIAKIALNDRYSIYRHIPKNPIPNIVVVAFDNIAGGLRKKGFGIDFLFKNNIESFFVSHKSKSFFQGLSESELNESLCKYLVGKKVFSYGASLGGYAAIYYSRVLNSKPLAFSPRCSVDPIYNDAHDWGVAFHHRFLNEKLCWDLSPPLVVIDPYELRDKIFYDSRIFPAYQENIHLVEMPYVKHGTAEAMLAQGILKKFVLSYFLNEELVVSNIDPWINPYSLSEMALLSAKSKDFINANKCLEKLVDLNVPRGCSRLRAYEILVRYGKLNHKFEKKLIVSSEKKHTHRVFFEKIKRSKSPQEFIFHNFNMQVWLMNYDLARELAVQSLEAYPAYTREHQLVEISERYLKNSEGLIF